MMMNSGNWERNTLGYSTVESLLEDVSKQMAMSNLSRFSRQSTQHTQRTSGSMRVVKPSSASSSPRGSKGLGRRRTVMADGPYQRKTAVPSQQAVPSVSAGFTSNDGLQVPVQSSRPVSWHPSTQQVPQMPSQLFYPAPTYDFNNQQFQYMPPTPAVYSSYTSPAMDYSPPAPVSYESYDQQYYQHTPAPQHPNNYLIAQQTMITEQQVQQPQEYRPTPMANFDPTMYSHYEWNSFVAPTASSFESSTAPPTPENFLPIQHPEPTVEAIPYEALDNEEDEGEHLVGLGLYDTPKSPEADPQLDNYRTLMMNQFLGQRFGRQEVESNGKGLKLEEGWTPPSDDEKDGEGEEDDDEEEDEDEVAPVAQEQSYQGNWV